MHELVSQYKKKTEALDLIEQISNPLGNHQHKHQRQTETNVSRSFDQNYRQTQSHANNTT